QSVHRDPGRRSRTAFGLRRRSRRRPRVADRAQPGPRGPQGRVRAHQRQRRHRGGLVPEVDRQVGGRPVSDTRIVVAEDEAISRMDLCEMLEHLGYTVVGQAGDGVAAVNLARALKPDLVLMDIKMPELDGISAAETLSEERT